jgi:DNA-binding transcriptional LysR family regulator
MRAMNELLATGPFDLYELQLFHLVAEHRNFTRAGIAAGLTQSAITRQIAGMELRLGVLLFDRTTRSVNLTPAGAALYARSAAILAGVTDAIKAVRTGSDAAPETLRIGISRTIGLAYLPGFFRKFQRAHQQVQLRVTHESSVYIMAAVEGGELDVGIITAPPVLANGVLATRRFQDEFVAIAPPQMAAPKSVAPAQLNALFAGKRWLLLGDETTAGKLLRVWMENAGIRADAALFADNPDLIVNLVSMGLGVSLVPHRALALYPHTRKVTRIIVKPKFVREIAIIAPAAHAHLRANDFVEAVLF